MTAETKKNGPVVQFDLVTKSYQMGNGPGVTALKKVSLRIPPKTFSMVLGPSGSGKTTLLNLIGCLDFPSAGKIEVCGEEIARFSDDAVSEFRAKHIAFIFQSFNLVPVLTAFENVEYALILLGIPEAERRTRTMQMLERVGLSDHAHHRPNQLSGGQRQRVAIARALVKNPSIVLADEPTANLDSKTGASIIELMHQIQEEHGATFIFSTHDPQVISHAEETFVIRDGEIVEHKSKAKA